MSAMWDATIWISLAVSACVGAFFPFALFSSKLSRERQKTETLNEQIQEAKTREQTAQESAQTLTQTLMVEREKSAGLQAKLEAQEQAAQKLAEHQSKIPEQIIDKITVALNEQVQSSQKTLAEATHREREDLRRNQLEQLQNIVTPLNLKLKDYQQQIQILSEKNQREQGGLFAYLDQMKEHLGQNRQATQHLTQALTHIKGRGNWGELQLEQLLKDSGVPYVKEPILPNKSKPDFSISLSDNRGLLIDVKTLQFDPNENFDSNLSAEARLESLSKKHAESLEEAVSKLSKKDYYLEIQNSEDFAPFVVLFVPRESMLALALESKPNLFEYAYRNNIILAAPFNIMGLLRLVNHGWNVMRLSKDANEIKKYAEELLARSADFYISLEKIGKAYKEADTSFKGRSGMLYQLKQIQKVGHLQIKDKDKKKRTLPLFSDGEVMNNEDNYDEESLVDMSLESTADSEDDNVPSLV